ncbi:TonB-dependent receptor plug domain-containing protein [Rhabdaerophilum calidifontis]|uniref:TonB-dependent receptor plug domain-containing protein n=1 Tax=Rhabdaerophilum calidifontis TaxID=2604328 RepID=UPI001239F7E0|nr:TonB-dependent receptor [Rhabdaerophilum calidifontis]
MSGLSRVACATSFACLLLTWAAPALAQTTPRQPAEPVLEITLTANRLPTAIQRTGSAITVVPRAEIERTNPASLVDVLRSVPGVSLTEAGGPGGTSDIRLRGANPNHTLVLIDGVRINDPAQASGEFDASIIAPSLIERIEVLRGPQSALYGSDAIGGVVNIITKRGRGQPSFSFGVEAGSYGTVSTVGSATGTVGPWSFAFSGTAQRADGFSRYGYRIDRLSNANNIHGIRGGKLEADGFERFGGYGRLGYDPGTGFRFELAGISVDTRAETDAGSGLASPGSTTFPDTASSAARRLNQITARTELDTWDGALTHAIQLFAARTERNFVNSTLSRTGGVLRETRTTSDFIGDRLGTEYQATFRMQQFGSLIAGARIERESADTFATNVLPIPGPRIRNVGAHQDTMSGFGLWQVPIGERLMVSLGARHDKISDSRGFSTWRTTAAYQIFETGTVLRASAGTGAKAPTLFQRFAVVGTPDLRPEFSTGFDAGIDQSFLKGRAKLSLTIFHNNIRNLVQFNNSAGCIAQTESRCYFNVDRAVTSGLEASARAEIIEGMLSMTAAYTYLHAKDEATNLTLQRRPQHTGRIALQWMPLPQVLIEPSVTLISERFSRSNERDRLAPFARLDMATSYRFNETWKASLRVENITNAKYQDVYNFGTTGRAAYAGLAATW